MDHYSYGVFFFILKTDSIQWETLVMPQKYLTQFIVNQEGSIILLDPRTYHSSFPTP